MSSKLKKILNFVGSAIALLAILFVCLRLKNFDFTLIFSRLNASDCFLLCGLAFFCVVSNIMLAYAWSNLLKHVGIFAPKRWVIKTYGLSQLAKYVPGNILQFFGRQVLGMAAGLKKWLLTQSMMWELGLIVLAGMLFSCLAVPLEWPKFPVFGVVTLFFIMSTIIVFILYKLISLAVSVAIIWQIIYLLLSAMIFVSILAIISPSIMSLKLFPVLCGAYILAWLAGLIVPGAPAGLGIREGILLILLKGMILETDLLMILVISRLITIFADVIYFALSYSIRINSYYAS